MVSPREIVVSTRQFNTAARLSSIHLICCPDSDNVLGASFSSARESMLTTECYEFIRIKGDWLDDDAMLFSVRNLALRSFFPLVKFGRIFAPIIHHLAEPLIVSAARPQGKMAH